MRALLIVTLVSACAATPHEADPPTGTSPSHVQPYEVHEWGLVRGVAGDVFSVGAVAPPLRVEPMIMDKPVLYFHTDAPLTLERVSVATPGGSILESWPLAQLADDRASLGWSNVTVDPGGACEPSPLPQEGEAPCAELPEGLECESSGLAVVRTDDAACVRLGGATEHFLFYRAQARLFTPPLSFTRTDVREDVRVTNDGDAAIPGVIVRISVDGGTTRTLFAKPPPPHGAVVIGHDYAATDIKAPNDESVGDRPSLPQDVTGPGRARLRDTMTELGMTTPEIDAFMSAWDATLFSSTPAVAADKFDGELAPRETFVYFLPEAMVEQIARLSFEPAPRVVRRAFAVWVNLPVTGTSR